MSEWQYGNDYYVGRREDDGIWRSVDPAYLNALEAEVERLKAKAALADEMRDWLWQAFPDTYPLTYEVGAWLARYDALKEPT